MFLVMVVMFRYISVSKLHVLLDGCKRKPLIAMYYLITEDFLENFAIGICKSHGARVNDHYLIMRKFDRL